MSNDNDARDQIMLDAQQASGRLEFERRRDAWIQWLSDCEDDEDDPVIRCVADLGAAIEHQLDRRGIKITGDMLRIVKNVVEHTAAGLRGEIADAVAAVRSEVYNELISLRTELVTERQAREADRKAMRRQIARATMGEARRAIGNLLANTVAINAAQARERIHHRSSKIRAERAKQKISPWQRQIGSQQ
jgi:hypothetical protein